MRTETGELKCKVSCPLCPKKTALSPYWAEDGPRFRVSNFEDHYNEHGGMINQFSSQKQSNEENSRRQKVFQKRLQVRNKIVKAENVRLKNELAKWKKKYFLLKSQTSHPVSKENTDQPQN